VNGCESHACKLGNETPAYARHHLWQLLEQLSDNDALDGVRLFVERHTEAQFDVDIAREPSAHEIVDRDDDQRRNDADPHVRKWLQNRTGAMHGNQHQRTVRR
jgi:hypothetical protein